MSAIRMPEPGRYHADRPGELRRRSHPLAYIGRHLPVVLEGLASELRVGPGDRVLDLGCADMPYRRFFPAGCEYVGADLPGNPGADVEIGPDGRLPLEDERFDAVLSTQVLEHVAVPATYLADAHRVLRLVLSGGLLPVAVGCAGGLAGAAAASRLLRSFLFEVGPTDPAAFCGAAVLVLAVALVACLVPARRAGKVDPMVSLRAD